MDGVEDNNGGLLVKFALGILASLIVGALFWVGSTLKELTNQVTSLQTNFTTTVSFLETSINEAKAANADKYTATQAASDYRSLDTQIKQNSGKIDDHEKRLRDLEMNELPRRK